MQSKKVNEILNEIESGGMVLPALQRKFVWNVERIENLFDSIYKGYPIGIFLSWKRKKEQLDNGNDRYYKFLTNYSEFNNYNNDELPLPIQDNRNVEVILDGQQRLSSLFIGLKGTYAYKEKGKLKSKSDSYPKRSLYFNLNSKQSDENEVEEIKYFKFMTEKEVEGSDWVLVRNVFDNDYLKKLQEKYKDSKNNTTIITNYIKLQSCIKNLELNFDVIDSDRTIDEVLDIFIRVNSGGTPLSKADLLYSNLTVEWPEARKSIDRLIETVISDTTFHINSDFIMRAAIYCVSDVISLKVSQLKNQASKIVSDWEKIESAIKNGFKLVNERWKFNDDDIRAKYSIIPIIYLFYNNELSNSFKDEINDNIKIYLIISNLKSIFGGSPDSILTSIKKCLGHLGEEAKNFSIENLFTYKLPGNRDFKIDEDFINNDLLLKQKGSDAKLVLSLLYANYDKQLAFHQDHMHPETICKKEEKIKKYFKGASEEKIKFIMDNYNRIPNLQLLEGSINESKNKTQLKDWVEKEYKDEKNKKDFFSRNYIDDNISLELNNFENFYNDRKKNMLIKLKKIFKI